MSEIIEEFFNGYCKNYDMARTAIGEFSEEKEVLKLEQIDCDYGNCIYSEDCEMMHKVFAFIKEREGKKKC